jgi:hypothetical protein
MTKKIDLEINKCSECPYAAVEDMLHPTEIRCTTKFGNHMLLFSTEQEKDKDIFTVEIDIPNWCELENV